MPGSGLVYARHGDLNRAAIWAVRNAADKYQIVCRAFVPAEVCEEELLPAMSFVATQADSLENTETGKDQN